MPRRVFTASTPSGPRPPLWPGLALLSLLLGALAPARAGIGGFTEPEGSAGDRPGFHPVNTDKVRMLSLRYEISLHVEYAEIFMEYVLRNPGPAVTVTMGFPCAGAEPVNGKGEAASAAVAAAPARRFPEFLPEVEPPPNSRFRIRTEEDEPVYVVRVPFLRGKGGGKDGPVKDWQVFRLDFKEGQTRRLQIRCREPLRRDGPGGAANQTPSLALDCLLSPAAVWKGPVRNGVVIVKNISSNARELQLNRPERFHRRAEGLTWNFSALEPEAADDVLISVSPAYESFPSPADGLNEYRRYQAGGVNGEPAEERWELHRRDYTAVASSVLVKQNGIKYGPDNLRFDTGESTAWIEGAARDGTGESVTLTLPRPDRVSRIGVVTGYVKTKELYLANNRVAELDISLDGGPPLRVSLPDERLERERFYIDLPGPHKPVRSVKLTIVSVHRGSRHEDTCLSEVVLVTPLEKRPEELSRK